MAELVPTGQEDRFIQKLADHYDTFNIKLGSKSMHTWLHLILLHYLQLILNDYIQIMTLLQRFNHGIYALENRWIESWKLILRYRWSLAKLAMHDLLVLPVIEYLKRWVDYHRYMFYQYPPPFVIIKYYSLKNSNSLKVVVISIHWSQ
jgi:hypothetical protein